MSLYGDTKMPDGDKKPSFEITEINRADGEVVITIREGFTQAFADALLAYRQHWNDKVNPAIASVGQFVRDAGRILRGEPVDRFPLIERMGIVTDESVYGDSEEVDAPPVEDTADVTVSV
jgi:hypothetical protein